MENLAAARFSIIGICLNLVNSSHDPLACHVLGIFDVFDLPLPQHCVLHHLIKNIFINYTSSLRNTYILTYYAIWQRTVAHPATQFQATSQNKGFEAQIHNTERNAASQTDHGITLPLNQPPISGKQLISSHSADQNQAMLYNIYFPPENISVAGLSIFPSGNNTSGQTYTLDTQQKNGKSTQDVTVPFRLIRPGV